MREEVSPALRQLMVKKFKTIQQMMINNHQINLLVR